MAGLFNIPSTRSTRSSDKSVTKKISNSGKSKPITIKGGGGLMDRIQSVVASVNSKLGKFANDYVVIRNDPQAFAEYIDYCIDQGVISIDTETTGLDTMLDDIVGLCLYCPGRPAVYVPLNHISYITQIRANNQLSIEDCRIHMQRLTDAGTKVIMFNAPFDLRVIWNQIGVRLHCYFDCMQASRLLNENEGKGNGGLKQLHKKYVLQGKGDAFSFGKLFDDIPFNLIPITSAYLYAAHDAIITYELYEYQKPFLTKDDPKCIEHDLQQVSSVFWDIEMPIVDVVVDMENTGVSLDYDVCEKLSKKYHQKMDEAQKHIDDVCAMYKDDIDSYRRSNPGCGLSDVFNPGSPKQLATLLYDILQLPVVDKRKPRGTGEEILEEIERKTGNPLCKAILTYRGISKLLSTYIDKMPEVANPNDKKVHCNFVQMGAATGRFSSNSPMDSELNWGFKIRLIQGRALA